MKKMSIFGSFVGGKFKADNPMDAKRLQMLSTSLEGKSAKLTLEQPIQPRTTSANSYYWFLVGKIAEHLGEHDTNNVHAMLKLELNSGLVTGRGMQEIRMPKSTATLTTQEFSDYVTRVQHWAATFLGLYLPDPGEADIQ